MFYQMVEHEFRALGPPHTFKALSYPLRLYIFEYLCHEELTAAELMNITGRDYKSIYKQLFVLEQNNLIESYIDGKFRYYHVPKYALVTVSSWMEFINDILNKREF